MLKTFNKYKVHHLLRSCIAAEPERVVSPHAEQYHGTGVSSEVVQLKGQVREKLDQKRDYARHPN
jgi:hypothetical protein